MTEPKGVSDEKGASARGLIDRAAGFIRLHGLLIGGETVLVGLSGGPDSVCLLAVLHRLHKGLSLNLHAVYIDHCMRPQETPAEAAFCRDLCGKLGVSFMTRTIDVPAFAKEQGMNKQEAARELRYKALQEIASEIGADRIALAHNADDQAETLLMRLIRGTGPKGLSGMPVRRGNIIRPLLGTCRDEIDDFLHSEGLRYCVDSSNLKTDYLRNRIRQSVMAELKRISPAVVGTMSRTAEVLREEERYFDILVTKSLMKMISRKTDRRIELFLSPMEGMDKVILRRLLRRAIDETRGLRAVGFGHIEDIMRLVKEGRAGQRIYLPGCIRVVRDYSLLILTSEPPVRISTYELMPPAQIAVSGAGVVIEASFVDEPEQAENGKMSVTLDAGLMTFPLMIRPREAGDFFYPLGFGRKKKLQDFFVDEKVPRDERDSAPLVVSDGKIVWAAGYRADDRFRVTDKTTKFLRLGIVKGKF